MGNMIFLGGNPRHLPRAFAIRMYSADSSISNLHAQFATKTGSSTVMKWLLRRDKKKAPALNYTLWVWDGGLLLNRGGLGLLPFTLESLKILLGHEFLGHTFYETKLGTKNMSQDSTQRSCILDPIFLEKELKGVSHMGASWWSDKRQRKWHSKPPNQSSTQTAKGHFPHLGMLK